MRKLLMLVGALLLGHVALLFVQAGEPVRPPSSNSTDVGIVFDLGGRGDKSFNDGAYLGGERARKDLADRKSTRLNSSHGYISYAVFCLKKKKKNKKDRT